MKLTKIQSITGKIELLTGLHIGSGNTEMHIGGTDNPVIKNPVTQQPYIPGSSIKGKMRSLLEWELGVVSLTKGKPLGFRDLKEPGINVTAAAEILKLFGGAPEGNSDSTAAAEIGPSRLSFWDCNPDPAWIKDMDGKNLLYTEVKMENSIDRIKGTAENPRNTERVPAGALFDFRLSIRVHDHEDLLRTVLKGMKLLELTGLGGSGSRGYGKIRFRDLVLDDASIQEKLDAVSFEQVA
jgi:CRISPR-associated protein Csm3